MENSPLIRASVIYLLILLIPCIPAIWLIGDLKRRNFGNRPLWVLGAIFLWAFVYPYYFYKTKRTKVAIIFILVVDILLPIIWLWSNLRPWLFALILGVLPK